MNYYDLFYYYIICGSVSLYEKVSIDDIGVCHGAKMLKFILFDFQVVIKKFKFSCKKVAKIFGVY